MSDAPIIMIPARYASSRYPGKVLAPVAGPGGEVKTLLQRSWEAAMAVAGTGAVYVVTDDARIAAAAERWGAAVLMSSARCRNGTERCADALMALPAKPRVVVNFQADALLTPPMCVEAVLAAFVPGADVAVATPVVAASDRQVAQLRADRRAGRIGGTTAVFGPGGDALYFSKEVLPSGARGRGLVYQHIGVYAYTPEALTRYVAWPQGRLEQAEGLEQLRFLENGQPIRCVEVAAGPRGFWELNNPTDLSVVETILQAEGQAEGVE